MEIISESILTKREFSIQNSSPFIKNIVGQSSQIYNNETNPFIKIQKIYKEINQKKENNTFYLDYLYYKNC